MMSQKRAQPESGTVFYVFPYMLYNTIHLYVGTYLLIFFVSFFIHCWNWFVHFSAVDERFFLIFFFRSLSLCILCRVVILHVLLYPIYSALYCINFLLGIIFAFCLATYLVNVLYGGVTGIFLHVMLPYRIEFLPGKSKIRIEMRKSNSELMVELRHRFRKLPLLYWLWRQNVNRWTKL